MLMLDLIRRAAERVLVWAACRQAEAIGLDLKLARDVANREVSQVAVSVFMRCRYIATEHQIIDARLRRRFDPGMLLNEVTRRAREQVDEVGRLERAAPDRVSLTAGQMMALEVQKRELERIAGMSR